MKKDNQVRVHIFLGAVFLLFGLVLYKLFVLSYLKHAYYARTAEAQTEHVSGILARGNIYFTDKDRNLVPAAINKKFPVVSLVPALLAKSDTGPIISALADITGMKTEQIAGVVNSHSDYARVLAKRLDSEQVAKIKGLHVRGVDITYDTDRFYPGQELGADVLGFLGYDGSGRSGQYGVESFYDQELFGKNSAPVGIFPVHALSKLSSLWTKKKSEPVQSDSSDRPKDIVLTIDANIQKFAEGALDAVLKKWSAAGVSVIVEEPGTGRILAMADRPGFNPNAYGTVKPELFLNGSLQQIFEPGSTMKPITMAAGLDLGKITPQTTYEDKGSVNIAGYTIKNFSEKVFGLQTMSGVLEKSINTGAMFVENLIGDDNFLNYVINMGFGQPTGIDLPGEVSGDITNLYSGRKINYLTSSFGQGIAVTPIQLINAYSAIANGGKLMKPYIVDKITGENGQSVATKPEIIGTPITEKTAAKLKSMLVGVVDNGFDKARIKGYDIAGKTGTAQIPDSHGGYLEDQFIHNFLGFAPAYNAKFVIMIKMDRPQGITFAADSLSPVFREMAAFLINYYNIPPTRN